MDERDLRRRETEALIEAIWGAPPAAPARPPQDPALRARQNEALAAAMRAYLQEYLTEAGAGVARPDGRSEVDARRE